MPLVCFVPLHIFVSREKAREREAGEATGRVIVSAKVGQGVDGGQEE